MGVKLPRATRHRAKMTRFSAADNKHDRCLLAFSTARMFYNFDFSSGVLRRGYGVKSHKYVPDDVSRYWVYRFYSEEDGGFVEQCIYQHTNGLLAYFDAKKNIEVYVSGVAFNELDAINYRLNSSDVLLLTCEGNKLMTWDGQKIKEYKNSPNISSMALHYERLFVTSRDEKTRVYFSKNLDPTQWEIGVDGGGFIELLDERGFLNKVVSFGSYLYIFRDHGISRITAYGDQTEFSVVNMFVTAGRIYPSSIATCGNCIVFLASDGLYMFDGFECNRVLTGIAPAIIADDCCASAYHNGKYYLACKMNFDDGEIVGCENYNNQYRTNALIVFDPNSNEYSLSRGLDIRYMNSCSIDGEDYLMCSDGGRGGVVELGAGRFLLSLNAYWESGLLDMGAPEKIKHITGIMFNNDVVDVRHTVYLGIAADGDEAKIEIAGEPTDGIRLGMSGRKFTFRLNTNNANVNITPMTVLYNTF